MPKRLSKNQPEVIANLIEVRQKLLDAALKFPSRNVEKVILGQWNIKDLFAHFIGWDYTNEMAIRQIILGEAPTFFEHQDRDWQTYNAGLIQEYGQGTFEEIIDRMRLSHKNLVTFIGAISAEDFHKSVTRKKAAITIPGLLNAEIRDEWKHLEELQARMAEME